MGVTRVAYEADGWGVGELWLDGDVVVWHELPAARPATGLQRNPVADVVVAYLAGDEIDLNEIPVDLGYETEFLTNCAHALRSVPRGETVTYGELAELAGSPGAARAAGSFCARNRLALFVPCHRVVSAGGLGSYGSHGLSYKKRLLELEGAL
jgi:methylated-DNA-[protein]-cysteine S-methyltransferase